MLKNRKIIAIITIFILATSIAYWYNQEAKQDQDFFQIFQSMLYPENDKYIEELEMKLFHAEMELARKNKAIKIYNQRCPDAMDPYLDFFVN